MNNRGKKSRSRTPDRRVQKTRKLLSEALVALILEKGYEAVSIQDIIDRANVGRSTFYSHYENKEQLLLWGHDHFKKLILAEGDSRINFVDFYRHVAEHRQLALSVMTQGSSRVVIHYLNDILRRNILLMYAPAAGRGEADRPLFALRADAAAAALVQLLTSWLTQGLPFSAEKMAEESAALIERIVAPDS